MDLAKKLNVVNVKINVLDKACNMVGRFLWDQVSNMAVVGLLFYILIQNDSTASNMAKALITQVQTTLTGYLTGTF